MSNLILFFMNGKQLFFILGIILPVISTGQQVSPLAIESSRANPPSKSLLIIEVDQAINEFSENKEPTSAEIDWLEELINQLATVSELLNEEGNYDSAAIYAEKAILVSRKIGSDKGFYRAARQAIQTYEILYEYQKAFQLQKELLVLSQGPMKASSSDEIKSITTSNLKKNLSEKEREFVALQASAKSRTILLLGIVTVLLILFIAFAYKQYLRDVHQLKKIQYQNKLIRQRNKEIALRIDELKQFAYIASHDLQTPLLGIVKIADWLNRDYANTLNSQGVELVDLMRSRAKRMESMLNGILTYFKIGSTSQKNELINLKELVSDVLKSINQEKKLTVKLDERDVKLIADRSQLKQVLYNLIHNSIHHNDKPIVSIKLSFEKKDADWSLVIQDNGPGIEQRLLKKVFDIFQQAHKTDETRSGIGLAIVKRIVAGWDCKISIESEPGIGSTVYLHLNDKMISKVEQPKKELVFS
ncbi:MAG: ATP-binding protein [Bacteroidota bacterium]